MKKIVILGFIGLAIAFTSCNKDNPVDDVDGCIKKLNYFSEKYEEFNADGVISKEKTIEGNKEIDSEFKQLKKIASEYYEMMNKINTKIKEEKEDAEKGKKIKGYEEDYKKALDERNADIEVATQRFHEIIAALGGETEKPEAIQEPEMIDSMAMDSTEIVEGEIETIEE